MSIDWPASTPESRRAAAAALGRLGITPFASTLQGLGALGGLETDELFRRVMSAGVAGTRYEGKNYPGLPLPDGVSVEDFIWFCSFYAYTNNNGASGSAKLFKNAYELATAFTDAGIADDAEDVADDFGWSITPSVIQDEGPYLPGGKVGYLEDNLYGWVQFGWSASIAGPDASPNRLATDPKATAGGWIYHYLGGIWAIFGVRKIFIDIIGRPPSRGELQSILVQNPVTVNAAKNIVQAAYDNLVKENRRIAESVTKIEAILESVTSAAAKTEAYATEALLAAQSFESVKKEMDGYSSTLSGLGVPPRSKRGKIQKATNAKMLELISRKAVRLVTGSEIPGAANLSTASAQSAAEVAAAAIPLIKNTVEAVREALAFAKNSAAAAEAEAELARAQKSQKDARNYETAARVAKDRAVAEDTRIKNEFQALKEKTRRDFLSKKRAFYMTLNEEGLRNEYAAIKDDPDVEMVAILVEVADSKGIDVTKEPFPVAAAVFGVLALAGGVWYFKSRK